MHEGLCETVGLQAPIVVKRELLGTTLTLSASALGRDLCVMLAGGAAHVGCTVLALPRPSLACEDEPGCTSSVINVVGHKDDVVCRMVAERLCIATGQVVACTGGFHVDGITTEGIVEVAAAVSDAIDELVALLG